MKHILANPDFLRWLLAFAVAALVSLFVILWASKKVQEQANEDEYASYFKRIEDADNSLRRALSEDRSTDKGREKE